MLLFAGSSAGVTMFQFVPSFRVSCTRPVLVPTQISPACTADGAIVVITPVGFAAGVFSVKSGLISVHVCALSPDFKTYCVPTYSALGSRGEKTRGVSHVYRYFAPGANTVAICPVVRSNLNTVPYQPTE